MIPCGDCDLPAVLCIPTDEFYTLACWYHGLDAMIIDLGENGIELDMLEDVPWLDVTDAA